MATVQRLCGKVDFRDRLCPLLHTSYSMRSGGRTLNNATNATYVQQILLAARRGRLTRYCSYCKVIEILMCFSTQ